MTTNAPAAAIAPLGATEPSRRRAAAAATSAGVRPPRRRTRHPPTARGSPAARDLPTGPPPPWAPSFPSPDAPEGRPLTPIAEEEDEDAASVHAAELLLESVFLTNSDGSRSGELDEAIAVLEVYFENPVGIGEHSNLLQEVLTWTEKLTDAEENIETLKKFVELEE